MQQIRASTANCNPATHATLTTHLSTPATTLQVHPIYYNMKGYVCCDVAKELGMVSAAHVIQHRLTVFNQVITNEIVSVL